MSELELPIYFLLLKSHISLFLYKGHTLHAA